MSKAKELPRAWRGYHPLETEQWFAALEAAHDREAEELIAAIRKERARGEQLSDDARQRRQAGAQPHSAAAVDEDADRGWMQGRIDRSAAAIRRQGEAEAAALRRLLEVREAEHEASVRDAERQLAECEAAIARLVAEADSLFEAMPAETEGDKATAELRSALAGIQAAALPASALPPNSRETVAPGDEAAAKSREPKAPDDEAAANRERGVRRAMEESARSAKVIQFRLKSMLGRVEAAGHWRAAGAAAQPDAEDFALAAGGAEAESGSAASRHAAAAAATMNAARAAAGVSATRSGRTGRPLYSAYWGDLEPYLQDNSDPEQLPQHTGPLVADPRLAGQRDAVPHLEEGEPKQAMQAVTGEVSSPSDSVAGSDNSGQSDEAADPAGAKAEDTGRADTLSAGGASAVLGAGTLPAGGDSAVLDTPPAGGASAMLGADTPPAGGASAVLGVDTPSAGPASAALSEEIRFVRERYIVGKTAGQSLRAADGRLLIAKGDRITAQTVADAEREGKLAELVVHMVIPGLGAEAR
ncbi:hypothetical protein ACFFSY_04545 [Paenibacillus aurantiacus]|uniref:Uncharacterized protein n=1 Tax=Paenibacillus aurantiacus TaxID=1936118 RepID=A0ABV5KIY6_9BACL